MSTAFSSDPFGHGVIQDRLTKIPHFLMKMLDEKLTTVSSTILNAHSFILTGIGSSESHARYLTLLMNLNTDRQVMFMSFTTFMQSTTKFRSNQILILFSQGLSPNAQMILKTGQKYFPHILVFTSMNKEQMIEKCPVIDGETIEIIRFPLHDEYITLIRVIGPACGFLAAILFIERFINKNLIEKEQLLKILTTNNWSSLSFSPAYSILRQAMIDDKTQQFSRGPFHLITSSALIDVSQNLLYKFVEGLYWSSPIIYDYLQFSHGPFQQLQYITDRKSAIVCLVDPSNQMDVELEQRLRKMIETCDKQQQSIDIYTLYLSSSSIIYTIFELEIKFNQLIFEIMRERCCNQIEWPGKGKDEPLYAFSG